MAIRLNFIVEGQTEETFVNTVLRSHLADFDVWTNARCVETSRQGNLKHSGGITDYARAKKDIQRWMRSDQNPDARFTTMFDLYALPADFPSYTDASRHPNPYDCVKALEDALSTDIADWRFIPYLQLHEFEALLLSQPQQIGTQFPGRHDAIGRLASAVSLFDSPELVNGGEKTAPSKRIIAKVPEYEGRKASAGPIIAGQIGLPALRSRCAHFAEWLSRLEVMDTELEVLDTDV